MKTIRVLILEDDLETISTIIKKLHLLQQKLEQQTPAATFSVVVLAEYTQVEEFINKSEKIDFDIILLDRDCKAGGSFHILDIERFGPEKIISISSIPSYNEEAKGRGVRRTVFKDYNNLEEFSDKVLGEIEELISYE